MVIAELIDKAFTWTGQQLGLHGELITIAVAATIIIWYGWEGSSLLATAGRMTRIGVLIVASISIVIIAGLALNVLQLQGSLGALLDTIAQLVNRVIH